MRQTHFFYFFFHIAFTCIYIWQIHWYTDKDKPEVLFVVLTSSRPLLRHYSCWSFQCCCPNVLPETVIFPLHNQNDENIHSWGGEIYLYHSQHSNTMKQHHLLSGIGWVINWVGLEKKGFPLSVWSRAGPIARYKSPAGSTFDNRLVREALV